jgi:hypothetical protein
MNTHLLAAASAIVLMKATAYAQMDGGQGGGMMGGNGGWGMGYGGGGLDNYRDPCRCGWRLCDETKVKAWNDEKQISAHLDF